MLLNRGGPLNIVFPIHGGQKNQAKAMEPQIKDLNNVRPDNHLSWINSDALQQFLEDDHVKNDDIENEEEEESSYGFQGGDLIGSDDICGSDIGQRNSCNITSGHHMNFIGPMTMSFKDRVYKKHKIWIKARHLEIRDSNNPNCWHWKPIKCGEVAILINDTVLDIRGRIFNTKEDKDYEAFLVFKILPNHNNIDHAYSKVTEPSLQLISLARYRKKRPDGWRETTLGELSGSPARQFNFRLTGADKHNPKFGLIVKGVEVRETET